ncbi:signal transduction histidine kinase [Evansella vedderi]|uniref:histidine kinase n=1 Tax=Evansella vedderi TaxID=38282 RepID=A0ABT9ZP42_9BACI|nr:ATP-binding protein [Evansella vedderi]MDQ0253007.1 signal transduction histidine kinase [Evansella vedderi]
MSNFSLFSRLTKAHIYIFLVAVIGWSLFFLHDIYIPNPTMLDWALFLLLTNAVVLLNKYRIILPFDRNSLSMDSAIYIAILFMYGLEMTLAVLIAGSILFAIIDRVTEWWKHIFNIAMFIITITVAHYVFILVGGETGILHLASSFPYILSMAVYFSINIIMISIVFQLRLPTSPPLLDVMKEVGKEAILNYVITLALAFILAMLLESYSIFGTIVFSFVVILTSLAFYKYFHLYDQMSNEKNYQEQILNSLPVGIITVGSIPSEIFLNSTAETLLNCNKTKINQLVTEEQIKNKEFWSIFSTEENFQNIKVTYISHDETFLLLVSQSQLYNQHQNPIGRIFFFIDITDTSEMETRMHQSEKLALLGELAAGAAHEIRNPLTVVHGLLSMLKKSFSTEDQRKFHFPLMLSEFERINFIIEEMLMVAKPGAPKFKEGKIRDIILEITDLYRKSTANQQLQFNINIEDTTLMMDEMQIKQVLHNIIRNSSEAMNGKGTILFFSKIERDHYHFYIQDTGTGIPKEIQGQIFNPFTTSKETGTGLGLTIVQRIIENHNGNIQLHSSSGNGTTFVISLPLLNKQEKNRLSS